MKNLVIVVVFMLVLIIGIAVGAQNEQWVQVNYILASTQMHLSTLIALSMLLGFILALVLLAAYLVRLKLHNKHLHHKIKRLSKQTEQA